MIGLETDPTAPFPGNRFIGASWRSGADAGTIARLRAAVAGWTLAEGPGWLLASEQATPFSQAAGVALALGRDRVFDRAAATFPDAPTLAASLARDGLAALGGMAAPFRAAWVEAESGALHAATDAFGVGHVFVAATDSAAFVASSATLLGRVLAAPVSRDAIAAYAHFGGFLAEETPYEGVSKLMAGASATLADGRLAIASAAAQAERQASTAEAFRAAVTAMLKAAPDAELELSGGLDSRLILAAMPQPARRGRRAITIGVANEPSEDVRIAGLIAAAEGVDLATLDAGGVAALDAWALRGLLARATAGYDHMANPLDKIALIVAGGGRKVNARFGGQNGEILRGFYYPGQPLDARPTEALARQLIAWRLTANDRVDETILAPAMRAELRAGAESRMVRLLLSFGGTWAETLDRFYLAQRMQGWVGNSAGNRLVEHAPLYPFFDPAFVAAAMATPAAEKLNSRAAYRLLTEIDPALARRPLADGVIPAALPSSPLASRFADLRLDAKRLAQRVRRRLMAAGRPTLGSQTVSQHWQRLGLYRDLPMDALAGTGFFDEAALGRIASGQWTPDRPTLGFLLLAGGLEIRA